jgi:type IV pilus assembly protein PilN
MRITLNLATRPFADLAPALKRLRIGMAVLTGLCILFGIGLRLFDREAETARARDHSLDGQIARVQSERETAQTTMRQPKNARVLTQAEALNQLFDEKAFSWTLAMEAMETVLPAGVQVTAIEPQRDKDGHITLHVRVVGPRDRADDLVANLERSRRFLEPRIVGETAESTNGPVQRQDPISPSNRFDFDLLADYNPPTLEERAANERIAAKSAHKSVDAAPHGSARRTSPRSNPAPSGPGGRQPYTGPPSSNPSPGGPNEKYFRNPTRGGPQ